MDEYVNKILYPDPVRKGGTEIEVSSEERGILDLLRLHPENRLSVETVVGDPEAQGDKRAVAKRSGRSPNCASWSLLQSQTARCLSLRTPRFLGRSPKVDPPLRSCASTSGRRGSGPESISRRAAWTPKTRRTIFASISKGASRGNEPRSRAHAEDDRPSSRRR